MRDSYGLVCPRPDGKFDREPLPFCGYVNLGNGTIFRVGIFLTRMVGDVDDILFVGVEGHGAYPFHNRAHPVATAEKLHLLTADAERVAAFINAQLGL